MKSLASSAITRRPKLLPFGNLVRPLPDYFESHSGQTAQAASHSQKRAPWARRQQGGIRMHRVLYQFRDVVENRHQPSSTSQRTQRSRVFYSWPKLARKFPKTCVSFGRFRPAGISVHQAPIAASCLRCFLAKRSGVQRSCWWKRGRLPHAVCQHLRSGFRTHILIKELAHQGIGAPRVFEFAHTFSD